MAPTMAVEFVPSADLWEREQRHAMLAMIVVATQCPAAALRRPHPRDVRSPDATMRDIGSACGSGRARRCCWPLGRARRRSAAGCCRLTVAGILEG